MTETRRLYSLRKARHILHTSYRWYKKSGKALPREQFQRFEDQLQRLDQALLKKDRSTADEMARQLEQFCGAAFKKSWFTYILELLFAIILALAIATVVRQMWFELYEIPTGSMRPTFAEQDHLTVSKLAFGINTPLRTSHFYFDPNLVQRASVLIFSGDQIPAIDANTTYFGIFPYKKRYIKRCIGKPGDTLYFYGGKLYGLDRAGNRIEELLDNRWMDGLEHIPFLSFEGKITMQNSSTFLFHQMNLPIGRLSLLNNGALLGEVFNGKEWVKDRPNTKPHDTIQTYSDFLGMRNFAMARLLTKQQVQQDTTLDSKDIGEGLLYLELRHTPSLSAPKPRLQGDSRGFGILLSPYTTVIPLQQEHLNALMDHMYTARFVVQDGRAHRYSVDEPSLGGYGQPRFNDVPNGTYEFYFGKAVRVGWGGITHALPTDHPLYQRTPENIQKLFNLGIEMASAFSPHPLNQSLFPSRYAYFRNGDLYLLGAPILKRGDSTLDAFLKREIQREQQAIASHPYIAFRDHGPPSDADIRTFGVKVPDTYYLVLGDNHAMSADSRIFGFVPQNNLQGAPSLIIWPPGDRLGRPMQKPYPLLNFPRAIVWGLALTIFCIWYAIHRYRLRRPYFKPLPR